MPRKKTERPQQSTTENIPPGFTLRHTLRGHTRTILSEAWSPDGTIFVSASDDQTIRLWDGRTGQHLRTLEGHSDDVNAVVWSPDGKLLASASKDRTIRLWDGRTGQHLQTLEGHSDDLSRVVWSPYGTFLASGSYSGNILLWDGQTSRRLRTLEGHSDMILAMAWSPDETFLVSGSYDRTIRFWDPNEGKQIRIFEEEIEAVDSLSFSHDGCFLASSDRNGTTHLRYKSSWNIVTTLEGPNLNKGSLRKGAIFHPQSPVLATVGEDSKVIHIWDLDFSTLQRLASKSSSVHYTSTKLPWLVKAVWASRGLVIALRRISLR